MRRVPVAGTLKHDYVQMKFLSEDSLAFSRVRPSGTEDITVIEVSTGAKQWVTENSSTNILRSLKVSSPPGGKETVAFVVRSEGETEEEVSIELREASTGQVLRTFKAKGQAALRCQDHTWRVQLTWTEPFLLLSCFSRTGPRGEVVCLGEEFVLDGDNCIEREDYGSVDGWGGKLMWREVDDIRHLDRTKLKLFVT